MHARTFIGDGVDYALVFDDGRVALYPRGGGSAGGRLVGTMAAAVDLVGELRPYEKGKTKLSHRHGQVFPAELEIDDKAIALLESVSPKVRQSPRERLEEIKAQYRELREEGERIERQLERELEAPPVEAPPVGPAVVAAAADLEDAITDGPGPHGMPVAPAKGKR